MLKFEITAYRVIDVPDSDKKYVSYALSVRQTNSETETPTESTINRRYTDFLNLYNNLKRDYGNLMTGVNFPKKVVMGNFDHELILCRSNGFDSLLEHIAKDTRLREASCTVDFLEKKELSEAKKYMSENKYDQALGLLEKSFKLLNKVYTDRSRVVLMSLCRLVACGSAGGVESSGLAGPVEKWASLAMRRFDGVSDADLLTLYVPLIRTCISIWKVLGKDYQSLESDLVCMKRRGMKVDACPSLLEAVVKLEKSMVTP